MNVHKDARLTLHGRGEMVRRVLEERQAPAGSGQRRRDLRKTVRKRVECIEIVIT